MKMYYHFYYSSHFQGPMNIRYKVGQEWLSKTDELNNYGNEISTETTLSRLDKVLCSLL